MGDVQKEQSEGDLLRRARRADAGAYHEMVDLYGERLYRLAYSLVGNREDAADVLQETFSGAFRGMRDFKERSSLKTWLCRILVKQAARHRRKEHRRRVISLEQCEESSGETAAATADITGDAKIDIEEAMRMLSPDHREVILLREMRGLSYEEISEVLGIPRGTVESRLFRARQELRTLLRDYETCAVRDRKERSDDVCV